MINGSFSIRRGQVKRHRAIYRCGFSVVRGLSLLFGISTAALPSWDQKSEAAQSDSRPDNMCCRNWTHCELASPVVPRRTPSHRGGTLASFLHDHAGVAPSRDQRKSLPSTHILCMITARRWVRATTAFLRPARFARLMAQAFSHDHFFTRVSMACAAS